MLMSNRGRPAHIRYLSGSYRVLVPGDHVVCAVTHQPIPLSELRYWSAERQEPYVDAWAALKAEGRE